MFKFFVVVGLLLTSICQAVHIQSKPAHIDIRTDKVSAIFGMIDDSLEADYAAQVAATISIKGPRVILINSPGGVVSSGAKIIDLMLIEKIHGTKMICVVGSMAHSMAFNILTFCDVRLSLPISRMVVHNIAVGGLDPSNRGTAKNLRQIADDMEKVEQPYRLANAKAMHLSLPDYDLFAENETCWTAAKLYLMGYLDGIATYEAK